ncbi:MAG TPA: hypothetical protein VHF89_01805 [Solirubrobacteraceae bacterium]|nr:hypothetical protein [Solirubrobacteraceae bacterium]
MRRGVALLAAVLLAGCGGSDGDPPETPGSGTPAAPPEAPAGYAREMRPIVAGVGRLLRDADLGRNRRDFDRGIALLEARRRMARITADPGLLLAHDRLAKAVARAGTLLVAKPGSPFARASRRSGLPAGTVSAVAIAGPALTSWSLETEQRFRAAKVAAPAWMSRERRAAQRLGARAVEQLR